MANRSRTALVTLVCTSALLGVLRFDTFQVGAFQDDAHYVVLAESLASGRGYRLINFPDEPWEQAFPPGWPFILSPLVALFPDDFGILKALSLGLWIGSLLLMWRLISRRLATPYRELLLALVAFHPAMVGASTMVMSEAAYLFFSLLTLTLSDWWQGGGGPQEEKGRRIIVAFVVLSALYTQLIRTIGFSILLALVCDQLLLRRYRRAALLAALIGIGLVPQVWFNTQAHGVLVSHGYEQQVFSGSIGTKFAQAWSNVLVYSSRKIPGTLIPAVGPRWADVLDHVGAGFIPPLVSAAVLMLMALGARWSFPRFRLGVLYVGFYTLALLTFGYQGVGLPQRRLLLPILPFLYFYLLEGFRGSVQRLCGRDERRTALAVGCAVSLLLVGSVGRNLQEWRRPVRDRLTDLSVGASWIREHAPAESVVMVQDPIPVYLYARRRTVGFPSDAEDLDDYLARHAVGYVMLSPRLQTPRTFELTEYASRRLLPTLASDPDRFSLVYRDSAQNVSVYQRFDQAPGPGRTSAQPKRN